MRVGMHGRSTALLSLRAAVCLTLPLAIGIATGHTHPATLFALGALWAVSQDGLDAWPVRSRRLLGIAVSVFVGFGIGAGIGLWIHGAGPRIVILGIAAGVSGYLQASGFVSFGAYGLLGTIVGSGLAAPRTAWWMPVATSLGALWVLAVASLMDRRSRHRVLRRCIADAFDALDRGIASIGQDSMFEERSAALRALDVAYDAVGANRPRRAIEEGVAIRQCLLVALHCGELASFLAADGGAPVRLPELAEVAHHLRTGSAQQAIRLLRQRDTRSHGPAVNSALEVPSEERAMTWSPHAIARFRPPPPERLRFAFLLGTCIAFATAVAIATRGPHGYWLPMSVAFIFRPDLGPVIRRAGARTVGTFIGVGIAGLVSLLGNPPLALIALSCAMAALMPTATRRGHGYAVITFTPIVFVFIAMLGNDRGLFVPRVLDTVLAALLVLVLDVFAWTTSPSLRPAAQLARAESAVGHYLVSSTTTPPVDRALARRAAFRSISGAADAEAMAEREPSVLRRSDPAITARLEQLLAVLDAHTARLFSGESR
jgi:uncharacterized membrane protein YccC